MKKTIINHLQRVVNPNVSIALLCGHYALFPDGNYVFPGIYQDSESPKLQALLKKNPYSGEFPVESFRFGLELKDHFKDAKFVNLVNDWMYVPKKDTKGHSENEFRKEYYNNSGIPCFFKFLLQEKNLIAREIYLEVPEKIRYQGNKYHFSETILRNRYATQKNKKYSKCSLGHGCSQEFVPLLETLVYLGINVFIAHIPGTCTEPVTAGIREAKEIINLPITVYSIHSYHPLSKDEFWKDAELYENGYLVNP